VSDTDNFSKSAISAKPAHPDTDQTLSNYSNTEHSHIRLVIIIALAVFFSEMVVMAVVLFLPLPNWLMVIFDAVLLIVLLSPILYLFMFRPLVGNIQQRKHSEAVLRESENRFRKRKSLSNGLSHQPGFHHHQSAGRRPHCGCQ
jgi:predicted ferric reductase